MKINNIPAKITVPAKQDVKYLYNHVSDMVKKEQVPTIFATDRIEISTSTNKQRENITNGLNALKAIFTVK